MTTTVDERLDGINAPLDATPDPDTTYPERYALISERSGERYVKVYKCRSVERGEWEVARTYLRDGSGIHSDPRCPAVAVSDTLADAVANLAIFEDDWVAVPVSVARQIIGEDDFQSARTVTIPRSAPH
jgi:hypothetical protein